MCTHTQHTSPTLTQLADLVEHRRGQHQCEGVVAPAPLLLHVELQRELRDLGAERVRELHRARGCGGGGVTHFGAGWWSAERFKWECYCDGAPGGRFGAKTMRFFGLHNLDSKSFVEALACENLPYGLTQGNELL